MRAPLLIIFLLFKYLVTITFFKYSCSPYLFHEGAFCFAMGEWRSINGKLVYGGRGQRFVTSFCRGVLLFVTKCDEEGVKNRPKSRDVIYGRPLRQNRLYQ